MARRPSSPAHRRRSSSYAPSRIAAPGFLLAAALTGLALVTGLTPLFVVGVGVAGAVVAVEEVRERILYPLRRTGERRSPSRTLRALRWLGSIGSATYRVAPAKRPPRRYMKQRVGRRGYTDRRGRHVRSTTTRVRKRVRHHR